VESCANLEILFLHSIGPEFGRLIRDELISVISMA
jgi:hypothetical protein